MCSHSIRFFVVVKRSYQNPGINNIGLNPLPSLLQSWHTGGFDNKKCISVTCDNWQQCAKRKHHWNLYAVYLGISQIAIAPLPSLHSYWNSGALFLWSIWSNLSMHHFDVPQSIFAPSLTKANTHLNFTFHCISAPNHPGTGSDPPNTSLCPFELGQFFSKLFAPNLLLVHFQSF